MKKRLFALFVCLVAVFGALASASGSASQTNILVSRNYLEGTFFQYLQSMVTQRVLEADAAITAAYLDGLGNLGRAYVEKLAPEDTDGIQWTTSGSFRQQVAKTDDIIVLAPGAGIVWTSGNVAMSGGVLVDLTEGTEVGEGALVPGHRYVAASETTLIVIGDTAAWSVEGQWHTTAEDAVKSEPDPDPDPTPEPTPDPEPVPDPGFKFTDVREGDWYYEAVRYVVDKGLFNGTSETTFAPQTTMNRAMLATVLYRMSGSPETVYADVFVDVPDGMWYSSAIVWAAESGIVKGMGNGEYQPMSSLTREQIALMLYNYANWRGFDTSARAELSSINDGAAVSSWAAEGMSWAVAAGLFQGDTNGNLTPRNPAIRAAVATLLQRFDLLESGETASE